MTEPLKTLEHSAYTIGWICALRIDLTAARVMLDEKHSPLAEADEFDTNSYQLGRIRTHNVVIACLPAEKTGMVSAALVAQNMLRSFQSIRFALLVGTGGGAPYYGSLNQCGMEDINEDCRDNGFDENDSVELRDIRLGDVVISLHSRSRCTDAVIQYDFGKSMQGKEFHRTGSLNKPPDRVLTAIANLQSLHEEEGHSISEVIFDVSRNSRIASLFRKPVSDEDRLFKSDVVHIEGKKSCKACVGTGGINIVDRNKRQDPSPMLHYGTIGSADQVMKDAILRDRWALKEGILCFEMEAAGLIDSFPCLIIKGVCNYADSHKNKVWQPYAAITAAAYAKEFLSKAIQAPVVATISPIINEIEKLTKKAILDEAERQTKEYYYQRVETAKSPPVFPKYETQATKKHKSASGEKDMSLVPAASQVSRLVQYGGIDSHSV